MAFEEIKAQISLLLEQMVNQPEDKHEVQEQLRERLNEMRAMGLPLPDDFLALERQLEKRFPGDRPLTVLQGGGGNLSPDANSFLIPVRASNIIPAIAGFEHAAHSDFASCHPMLRRKGALP